MGSATKVYLITGFLGSGKTTFLNYLIQHFPKDRKLMILMNEFGEVGVDGTLVEGDDLDMLEISKGSIFCVCVKTDFIKGLNEIAQKTRPDVLLIESTGVANPTDLKRDLTLPIFKDRFQMAEQICLVDAVHFADEYEVFASVEKQIASSTLFIINKVDLATSEQVATVKELIRRHHPDPEWLETTYAQIPVERFVGFPMPTSDETEEGTPLTPEELDEAIELLLDDPDREVTPPDRLLSAVFLWNGGSLEEFKRLMAALPPQIVRAKGFFEAGGASWLFNLVMNQKELKQAALPEKRAYLMNRLVFIAPPEIMNSMEDLVKEFPALTQGPVFDPMAFQA